MGPATGTRLSIPSHSKLGLSKQHLHRVARLLMVLVQPREMLPAPLQISQPILTQLVNGVTVLMFHLHLCQGRALPVRPGQQD